MTKCIPVTQDLRSAGVSSVTEGTLTIPVRNEARQAVKTLKNCILTLLLVDVVVLRYHFSIKKSYGSGLNIKEIRRLFHVSKGFTICFKDTRQT